MKLSKAELLAQAKTEGYKPETLEKVYCMLDIFRQIISIPYLQERLILKARETIRDTKIDTKNAINPEWLSCAKQKIESAKKNLKLASYLTSGDFVEEALPHLTQSYFDTVAALLILSGKELANNEALSKMQFYLPDDMQKNLSNDYRREAISQDTSTRDRCCKNTYRLCQCKNQLLTE